MKRNEEKTEKESPSIGFDFHPFSEKSKHYFQLFLVIAGSILFLFVVYRWNKVSSLLGNAMSAVMPVICGSIIAYILNPVVNTFDHFFYQLYKKNAGKKERSRKNILSLLTGRLFAGRKCGEKVIRSVRRISVFISILLTLLVLGLVVYLVIPEVIASITNLVADFPQSDWSVEKLLQKLPFHENSLYKKMEPAVDHAMDSVENWLQNDFLTKIGDWVGYVATGLSSVFSVIYNLLIGLVVAVYVLLDKEKFAAQTRKLVTGCFREKTSAKLLNVAARAHAIFGHAITGKILDSAIVGVLCFLLLLIFRIPYAALVGVIIGVTNVIPFLGPYIGAIPSALLIMIEDPVKGIYFIVIIVILQQIDCNYLDPKIVGGSIGLSPFWEIFACLLGGGLFGLTGLLLGVPAFALIMVIIKDSLETTLQKKGKSTDTMDYYLEDEINRKRTQDER